MRIIKTKVYKFEELTEKQKEKVIENMCDINAGFEWWLPVYEDAEQIGLKIEEFDIDRGAYCEGKFSLSANEVAQNILNNHGESCESHKTAKSFMEEWEPVFSDYMNESSEGYESKENEDKLMELEENFLKSLLDDYLKMLREEYKYQTSDEAIMETIIANDYEFDEEGNLI